MHIDIPVLISCLSLFVAVIVAITNITRNARHDNQSDAAEMTTVIVKLETISDGVKEIKGDMNNMRSDVQALRVQVIRNEQSVAEVHRRLEMLEKWKEDNSNA